MKLMVISALLSVAMLAGCSHVQDSKRLPASVTDVEVIGPDDDYTQKFPCGLKGSVEERIEDCSHQLSSENNGFVLVTRTKKFKEVHKDTKTSLLWGDRLPVIMDYYSAVKACKAGLAEVAGINDSVTWRLPFKEEYKEAEKNGIRKALPNMNYVFWSSPSRRIDSKFAWPFDGEYDGKTTFVFPDDGYKLSVRCVAR